VAGIASCSNLPADTDKPLAAKTTTLTTSMTTTAVTKPTTASAKNGSINDKLLSFWNSLPSTQWFFDDGKQAEMG
jgi:hypothetical protein